MQRIRTTHTGSLPRPADLAGMLDAHDRGRDVEEPDARVRQAVADLVARQAEAGLDVVGEGAELASRELSAGG